MKSLLSILCCALCGFLTTAGGGRAQGSHPRQLHTKHLRLSSVERESHRHGQHHISRRALAQRWFEVARGTGLRVSVHVGTSCLPDARTLPGLKFTNPDLMAYQLCLAAGAPMLSARPGHPTQFPHPRVIVTTTKPTL